MRLSDIKNNACPIFSDMHTEDCLLIFDSLGNITDCNQNSLDLFDISDKQGLIKQFSALSSKYPPEKLISEDTFDACVKKALDGEKVSMDWIFSRTDGRLIQTHVRLACDDQAHVLCNIRMRYEDDKNLKKKLAIAEEQRVRVMLDSIPAICTFWNEERNPVFCNQSAADLFGFDKPQDYLDRFEELSPPHQPCGAVSIEKAMHYVNAAFETGYSQFDWMHQKPDGTPMPSQVTLVRVNWQDEYGLVGFTEDMREKYAERELHESYQARLQFIIDNIPMLVGIWDADGSMMDCNEFTLDTLSISHNTSHYLDISAPIQSCGTASASLAKRYLEQAYNNGNTKFNWIYKKPSGEEIPCEVSLLLAQWEGKPAIVSIARDMRNFLKYRETESAIQQRLQAMLDASPMVCAIFDENINVVEVNQVIVDILKLSSKQEYIDNFFKLTPEFQPDGISTQEKAIAAFTNAVQFGEGHIKEWVQLSSDGEDIPFELFLKSMDIDGKKSVIVYARDLREYHKLANYENSSKQRMQAMLDASPIICAIFDENVNVVEVNQAAVNILKLTNKQEYIDRFFDLMPELQPDGTLTKEKAIEAVAHTNKMSEGYIEEWMMFDSENELIPFEVHLKSMEFDGKTAIVMYSRDLREQYKLREMERNVEQRFRAMLDASPMACCVTDNDYNVVDCNQVTIDLFELKSKQEYCDNFKRLSPQYQPDGVPSQTKMLEVLEIVFSTGKCTFEWMHCTLDGKPIPCEVTLEYVVLDEKPMTIGYIRDLREEKAMLARLEAAFEIEREASEMVSELLEASPMFIEIRNDQLALIDCNGHVEGLFGAASKEDFIRENEKYYPEYQPCGTPSKEKEAALLEQALKDGYAKFEYTHLDANGEELPLEFTYIRLRHRDKITIIGYAYDLRHIKLVEEQRIEIAEESNRAKSRFLARMSHEIRTPISAVLGLSEIQLRNHTMPPQTEEVFAKIYDSAKILLNIVNDILDFSKIESGKMSLVNIEYDVASLINDASHLHLIYLNHENVSFQLHVDENIPSVLEGDALRIRQIMNNLLTNAFKYTESGSVNLSFHCEKSEDEEGYINLIISILDTGVGMTTAQINEIQDLNNEYVRLHEQDKPFISGTGLGFPIVHSLAQMMNAHIKLISRVGKGTQVVVRIPQKIANSEVLGKELARSLQNFESNTWLSSKEFDFEPEPMPYGKVLVVDDIDTNLYVAEAMLESFELNIELCESGMDAIEKIKQGNVYDIIFMDHMMPDMDGIKATKTLRDMGYDHPIVALTANAVKGQDEIFMNNGFSGFMSKPIDINRLNSYLVRFIKNKYKDNYS
ncbi:MAG: PAS domain-containing protein [Defluviitaleaceae bacterium]|nr:PAS domain-containing protein [Defluviitaleaceae bacterium]